MSYTLFNSTTAATDLIAQPGRAVNTFPSGLVRVDQTYLGLTANATAHRATLAVGNDMPDGDTSPCIDGLKIFPEVQERRREDGWTEYIVSAYGRANTTGKTTRPINLVTDYSGYNYRGVQLSSVILASSTTLPTPPATPITYNFTTPDSWRAVPASVDNIGGLYYLDSSLFYYIWRAAAGVDVYTVLAAVSLQLSASSFTNYGFVDEAVLTFDAPLSYPFPCTGSFALKNANGDTIGTVGGLFA